MTRLTARFALTTFLSAFLLFQVEPIAARFLVPWFGGSSAVWGTCLLFFQVALLAGYAYAHGLIRWAKPRTQATIHLCLLAVSTVVTLVLHLTPASAWKPPTGSGGDPTGRILLVLLLTVGLPYGTLATTGPLLQAWYAEAAARRGESGVFPYRLYALSNVGSLLALLTYPIVFEPILPLHTQAWVWAGAFVVFALTCGSLAWGLLRGGSDEKAGALSAVEMADLETGAPPAPRRRLYAYWLLLAAIPSAMLLAVTSHVTQNVAAVPFLWVLPLTLYLLTFIVCFGVKQWRWSKGFLPVPTLACALMAYALSSDNINMGVNILLPLWMAGLFVGCLVCHGEIARTKPAPRFLTAYYLTLSVGGALGGLFVAFVAPRVFPAYDELPITVVAVAVVSLFALYREPGDKWWEPSWLVACALTISLAYYLRGEVRAGLADCRVSVRNFYGVLQVRDSTGTGTADDPIIRSLNNGTILHGNEFILPQSRHLSPTTYYGPDSGVGRAVKLLRSAKNDGPLRIGVIGLGTGTMAAYGRAGDGLVFYDINPADIHLAQTEFDYVRSTKATVEIVEGDARLSLEREAARRYDVLAVDAFSSDSIPVHLLTREAFAQYFRHLAPGGILCVHVSNRHVDLQPVVAHAATEAGKTALLVQDGEDDSQAISASEWVLVSDRPGLANASALKGATAAPNTLPNFPGWTDDYVNLWSLLKGE